MLNTLIDKIATNTDLVTTYSSDIIDLCGNNGTDSSQYAQGAKTLSLASTFSDATDVAKVFASTAIDTSTDLVTLTAHGLVTGEVGQLTTSGALPTGLSLLTNYYIIRASANTFGFATSYANAIAGTLINLTAQGSGNDTFTPTALAATISYYIGNDKTSLKLAQAATAITAAGGAYFGVVGIPTFRYFQYVYGVTAGALTTSDALLVKGEQS